MTIVTIVMIMAAIVAPAAARAYAIFRAQEFASDVLMMARAARREAMESGRATVVRFNPDGVEVRRGDSSLCRGTSWATVFTNECDSSDDIDGVNCAAFVVTDGYDTGFHSVALAPVDGAGFDVCYQPNGEAMAVANGGTNFTRIAPDVAVAAQYVVRRLEGGTSVDPVRTLIIPFDSSPRSGR